MSHGLSIDEPLTVEGIIRSAFANPHRAKYPDFVTRIYCIDQISFCHSFTADAMIQMVKSMIPKVEEKFNKAQIRARDVRNFHKTSRSGNYNESGERVDSSAYLQAIKNSRWCGPYNGNENCLSFYSIDFTGENKQLYYLALQLFLPENSDSNRSISFYWHKRSAMIRSKCLFTNS